MTKEDLLKSSSEEEDGFGAFGSEEKKQGGKEEEDGFGDFGDFGG